MIKGFYIYVLVLLLMGLMFNLYPRLPRFPWDININKGIQIYIPIISSIAVAIILSIILNLL